MLRKNLLHVAGSQAIVLAAGFIKTLLVPAVLHVQDYAYWQMYAFYTLYVGLFSFGYPDGLYLQNGGKSIVDLDQQKLRSSTFVYIVILGGCAAFVTVTAASTENPSRALVLGGLAINVLVMGVLAKLSLLLQATNEMKRVAQLNLADKLIFTTLLGALFLEPLRNFAFVMAADLLAKIAAMLYFVSLYRGFFFGSRAGITIALREYFASVAAGLVLLIANLAGMLIFGVSRMVVEYSGDLERYAAFSLSTTLASISLTLVISIGTVLYPELKKRGDAQFSALFDRANENFSFLFYFILLSYFPSAGFIILIVPEYASALNFLAPMIVLVGVQAKANVIINTFLKAMRRENFLLIINLSTLVVVAAVGYVVFHLTDSLSALLLSNLAIVATSTFICELYLRRRLRSSISLDVVRDVGLGLALLGTSEILPVWVGAIVWIVFGFAFFRMNVR